MNSRKKLISKNFSFLLFFTLTLIFQAPLFASPNSSSDWKSKIPDSLKSWIPWVTKDLELKKCPFLYNNYQMKECSWPSELSLNLKNSSASFEFKVSLDEDDFIILPGGAGSAWPLNVKSKDQEISVVERDSTPSVFFKKGSYLIQGDFLWNNLPKNLKLPTNIGLLKLKVNEKDIFFPEISSDGRLEIQTAVVENKETKQKISNSENIKVYRKVIDSLPAVIETQVKLEISGQQRKLNLNNILLPNFKLAAIDSNLPIEIDNLGNISISVRPGLYTISAALFSNKELKDLNLQAKNNDSSWPNSEIWSFQASPTLRSLEVDGVASVDPKLSDLPQEWADLPAFLMEEKSVFKLIEKQRGEAKTNKDEVTLSRMLKLNFEGKGYTVIDSLQGRVSEDKHLQIDSSYNLGRTSINGEDQIITNISKNKNSGIEIREGELSLRAESKLNKGSEILFPGWNLELSDTSVSMQIPNGWDIFHISGPEYVTGSIISKWTLLDLFIVLLASVALCKVCGLKYAALGTLSMLLFEKNNFRIAWILIILLILIAITKALKDSTSTLTKRLFFLKNIILVLTLITIALNLFTELRLAIYPQLSGLALNEDQSPSPSIYAKYSNHNAQNQAIPMPAQEQMADKQLAAGTGNNIELDEMNAYEGKKDYSFSSSRIGSIAFPRSVSKFKEEPIEKKQYLVMPDKSVNQGFGISTWKNYSYYSYYNNISFGWKSSSSDQKKVKFILINPSMNLFITAIRCISTLLLFLLLMGQSSISSIKNTINKLSPNLGSQSITSIIFSCTLVFAILLFQNTANSEPNTPSISPNKTEIPSEFLLNELRNYTTTKLTENPKCSPNCASISSLNLKIEKDSIELNLKVAAEAETYIHLPLLRKDLYINKITLNNSDENIRIKTSDQSYLAVAINEGQNNIKIDATLASREQINLNFPLIPKYTSYTSDGWEVSGISPDGQMDSTITLQPKIRISENISSPEETRDLSLDASTEASNTVIKNLADNFLIERRINLGFDIKIETHVLRLSRADNRTEIIFPLLKKESVTSGDFEVTDNKIKISFAAGSNEAYFTSNLKLDNSNKITLKAAESSPWNEVWFLNASNLWHYQYSGTPRIYSNASSSPEWHPRQGESLILELEQPKGVTGHDVVVDKVNVYANIGESSQDYTLTIDIRSSKGGTHQIFLPEGAKTYSLKRSNANVSISQKARALSLSLLPGTQNMEIKWRVSEKLKSNFNLKDIEMNAPTANINISYEIPRSRWVLRAGGSIHGPAILFWSYLPYVVLLILILTQIKISDIKSFQWALLLLGLSQVQAADTIIVIAWFITVSNWNSIKDAFSGAFVTAKKVIILIFTLIAFSSLFNAIKTGLLYSPSMRITGNGSSAFLLNWYHDLSDSILPSPWFFSLSVWWYRALMLLWALWLAAFIVKQAKWAYKKVFVEK